MKDFNFLFHILIFSIIIVYIRADLSPSEYERRGSFDWLKHKVRKLKERLPLYLDDAENSNSDVNSDPESTFTKTSNQEPQGFYSTFDAPDSFGSFSNDHPIPMAYNHGASFTITPEMTNKSQYQKLEDSKVSSAIPRTEPSKNKYLNSKQEGATSQKDQTEIQKETKVDQEPISDSFYFSNYSNKRAYNEYLDDDDIIGFKQVLIKIIDDLKTKNPDLYHEYIDALSRLKSKTIYHRAFNIWNAIGDKNILDPFPKVATSLIFHGWISIFLPIFMAISTILVFKLCFGNLF